MIVGFDEESDIGSLIGSNVGHSVVVVGSVVEHCTACSSIVDAGHHQVPCTVHNIDTTIFLISETICQNECYVEKTHPHMLTLTLNDKDTNKKRDFKISADSPCIPFTFTSDQLHCRTWRLKASSSLFPVETSFHKWIQIASGDLPTRSPLVSVSSLYT